MTWLNNFLDWQGTEAHEKIVMLGKIEGRRKWGRQKMKWVGGITDSVDMSEQTPGDSEGQGSLACCSLWVTDSQTRLSD